MRRDEKEGNSEENTYIKVDAQRGAKDDTRPPEIFGQDCREPKLPTRFEEQVNRLREQNKGI